MRKLARIVVLTLLAASATIAGSATVACSGPDADAERSGASGSDLIVRPGPFSFPLAASVNVTRNDAPGAVGSSFLGLSYAKGVMNQGLFNASNGPLVALFKQLGPGVLRVGGGGVNGVDNNAWVRAGTPGTPHQITQGDLTNLAGFLQKTGWSVLYGVNMLTQCNDDSQEAADSGAESCQVVATSVAADEAQAAAQTLGSSLYGFEIGNEPEVYAAKNQGQGQLGSYQAFKFVWGELYGAMHAAAPSAAFTGPAASGSFDTNAGSTVETYTLPFASDERRNINLLTQHYYRDNAASSTATLGELLAPDPNVNQVLGAMRGVAGSNGLSRGYMIGEANSFSGGGVPHVSDSFGTALWALDFLYANAANGSSGVSFYGGGFGDGLTPIADNQGGQVCDTGTAGDCSLSADRAAGIPADPAVRPIFYALKLFSLAGQGLVIGSTLSWTSEFSSSASSYAVANGLHNNVVLVNKDATRPVAFTVTFGESVANATLTTMQGPSITSSAGPFTINGASINPDGSFSPAAPTSLAVTNGNEIVLSVPAGSAALINETDVCTASAQTCCNENGGVWVENFCWHFILE